MVTHDTPAAVSTIHSEPRTARPATAIVKVVREITDIEQPLMPAKVLGIWAGGLAFLTYEVVSMRTVTIKDIRDGKVARETTDVGQE